MTVFTSPILVSLALLLFKVMVRAYVLYPPQTPKSTKWGGTASVPAFNVCNG